jgi:type VI protein secretion system component VasF
VPDSDVDPQNLPNPTTAEANQARKREFIPGWALMGIAAVIVAVVLFAVLR